MVLGEALRSLASVALFATSGTGLTELLPAVRRLPLGRRLAHAYLLGVAWTAGSLYALSYWLAVPIRPRAVLTVALVPALAGALCWRYRSRFPRPADTPALARVGPSARHAQRLALVCGGLVTVALLCDALTNPLTDWDGRMTWSSQARYVRAEGTVEPRVLTTPGFYVTCPGYPLLMPVAQAAVLEVSHASIDHHAFRPLYAAFFPVWLLVLYGGAQLSAGREAAAWATLAAALLSVPAFANAGGAVSAYSDLPLACFVGAGALLLLGPQVKPSAGLAAGILLAAGALTKAEGEILTLLAILVAAVLPLSIPGAARRREIWRRRRTMLVLAAFPVALALLLLHSWRAGIPARFESFTRLTSWSLLWPGIFTRLPTLAHDAGAAMLSFVYWGAFWWVAPLVVLAGWRALRRRPARALLLLAGAPLGVGWLYATIAVDPNFIVLTTWDRFLIQASVPMFVVFAMALRDLVRGAHLLSAPPRRGGRLPARATVAGRGAPPQDRASHHAGRAAREAPLPPRPLAPMLRLLADENFNGRILRALKRQLPDLDVVRAQFWADSPADVIDVAVSEAEKAGLTAALATGCEELITTEKGTKRLARATSVRVRSI